MSKNFGGWCLERGTDGTYHVVPRKDLATHITYEERCTCEPELNVDGVVVHNAFDGREEYEQGRRKVH